MTVSSITPVNNYAGNASNTTFDFDFLIEKASELLVVHTSNGGISTELKEGIDYSINEIGNEQGSYITFPLNQSSFNVLQNDEVISLSLNLEIQQESKFENSSELNLEVLEWTFDYVVRLIQILNRKIQRAVKVQEGSNILPDELIEEIREARNSAVHCVDEASGYAAEANQTKDEVEELYASSIQACKKEVDKAKSYSNEVNDSLDTVRDVLDVANNRAKINLSNLSSDGEKHFINKTQVTNCILESPHMVDITLNAGTITIAAGFRVIVPYGTSAPQKEIGDSLNGGTIVDISWNDGKLFYIVEYGEKTYSYTGSTTNAEGLLFIRSDGSIWLDRIANTASGTSPSSSYTGVYYNTSTNVVSRYTSGSASFTNASLPFCKLEFGTNYTNNIGEIKEVFQATGYIGSTMWAMKGIKLLSGNGRNNDGSLNNRNVTTNYVYINSATTSYSGYFGFNGAGIYSFRIAMVDSLPETVVNSTYYYVIPENRWYWSGTEGTPTQGSLGILGSIVRTADGIQSMSPYETFRAVDYNEYNDRLRIIETYSNGSSWYRIWSDGWCEQGGLHTASTTTSTISLLKNFKNTNYNISLTTYRPEGSIQGDHAMVTSYTTSTITVVKNATITTIWSASGYIT